MSITQIRLNEQATPKDIANEEPIGNLDGSNKAFTLVNTPADNTEKVFLNGVRQKKGGADQQQTNDAGSQVAIFNSNNLIQTFVPSITGNITKIELEAHRVSGSDVHHFVIADNSAQPGVTIGSQDFAPTGDQKFFVVFATPVPVTAGTTYQLYITANAGTNRVDYYASDGNSDYYPAGTLFINGSDQTPVDLYFKIFMDNAGDYSISGNTISFSDAPVSTDSILVDYRY